MKALNDSSGRNLSTVSTEIVYFNRLSEDDFKKIAGLCWMSSALRMAEKDLKLVYDDSLIEYLTRNPSPSRTAPESPPADQKEIEDRVASEIIDNYARPAKQNRLTAVDGKIQILVA